ncbi:MAG: zinc ABC transporter substrate-binding protein [Nitrospirae bacterium]|nr:zinc ABC transporter substrate-binding protein [Nitrospirota bacterium]
MVATPPFLPDFAERVGGNRVRVSSLLTGLESEHTYTPKPADIQRVREADVLIQVGLGLEVWVDGLIRNAANPRMKMLVASKGIPLLRDESAPHDEDHDGDHDDEHGHGHGMGNPHIWLDPERAKEMVRNITEGMIQADPQGKKIYLANQGTYLGELDALTREISRSLKDLPNRTIVTHHPAWPYFAKRFGLRVAGDIHTQVGSEPSARHIAEMLRLMKKEKVRLIVSEPQLSPKFPQALARETGARIAVLTPLPNGVPGTETYLKMMRYNADQVARGLRREK